MSKDLFIKAHEEEIEQYLLNHPETSEAEAYDKTADKAYDRYRDKFADLADSVKQRLKDEGRWL